ncbi:hypothetical protein MUK70_12010 [Dyadobacter chenwenxiniae]|uniref:Uncharacterized protein n=1 Tax=Dyadobacter chenwenxiniae TaxID=2906456 RepID=A0A9X1TCD8_9BACT|nr:hypothetical protein [Dyadobacter chenwenxiniae]MCF0059967.1 hypothetical protein [Dyadobacter chenwenxiniae]UON85706.1 hypothetical protein MUK70_12010 [Dyadobacter chenwenxiniae]
MKTLIMCLCLALLSVGAYAQKVAVLKSTYNATVEDTVTNTTPKTQQVGVGQYWPAASIKVDLTRISGTLAGMLRTFGSFDNVNFVKTDSATVTNAATYKRSLDISPTKYNFYRVTYTPTGTMSTKMRSQIEVKK